MRDEQGIVCDFCKTERGFRNGPMDKYESSWDERTYGTYTNRFSSKYSHALNGNPSLQYVDLCPRCVEKVFDLLKKEGVTVHTTLPWSNGMASP